MKKWWRSQANLTRFQISNMAWGTGLFLIGILAGSTFLIVAAAISIGVPGLLIEFSRALTLDWMKAYDEIQEEKRKAVFFGGVQKPSSDGDQPGPV